jgi:hypothetical protein
MYRQGDVLLRRIKAPKTTGKRQATDGGRVVLALGEVTGHAHALPASDATLWLHDTRRLLEVVAPTKLFHEEHAPIPLGRGWYEVIRQREWEVGVVAD